MSVFVIPVVAIIMSLGLAMLVLWTYHQRKSQMLAQQHRERMAAIEKGIELPPPVNVDEIDGSSSPNTTNPARVLRSGVLLVSIGIVLYFALNESGGREGALFGLIPAAVGLANLVYAAALFNNERKANEEKARKRFPEA